MTLGILVNWFALARLLGLFTIFFYVVIYTIGADKRWTAQEQIVIGGARRGAARPVVAGAVAATGSLSMEPVLMLFLIIFFWTPPQLLRALALFRYRRITRAPGCRCCRWSPAPMRRGCRSCSIQSCWLQSHSHPGRSAISTLVYGLTSLLLGSGMLALG